jgi:acetyl-CoA synthetase
VHCTGGYMVYTYTTSKYVFAMNPGDVYWCVQTGKG